MSIDNEKYVKIRTVTDGLPEEEERSIGGGAVDSVNGKTGNVVLTGKDIKATVTTADGQSVTLPITDQLQSLINNQSGAAGDITQIESLIPTSASPANLLATQEDITSVNNAVSTESTRAQLAEENLSGAITTESARAKSAEEALSTKIGDNTTAIGENKTAIENETARAEKAESDLNDKIETNITAIEGNQTAIQNEVTRATQAEEALDTKIATNASNIATNSTAIEAETTRAQGIETDLRNDLTAHIDDKDNPHEVTKSQVGLGNVDNTSDIDKPVSTAQTAAINSAVASEASARESAINELAEKVQGIEDIIPSTATESNELADKAFVNSSVQTATANFRGNWATWADVPTDANEYPVDYAGSKVPTVNDYLVVSDASGFTGETLQGTWRFKYSGVWATDGKAGWLPEYQVNEEPLTMAQLDALNSGVTAELLATIQSDITNNSNSISQVQTNVTAQLATKADNVTVDSLTTTVNSLSATVDTKADQSALTSGLATKLNIAQGATNSGKLLKVGTDGNITVGESVSALATTDALNAGLATKADNSTVTALSETVATKASQADLIALSTTVNNKADSSTVTSELATKATKATDFITPITAENKGATQTELTELEEKIAEQFKAKANTDLANVSDAGKDFIAHQAMPSDRYIDLTLDETNSYYTAPADGYFFISKISNANQYLNGYIVPSNSTTRIIGSNKMSNANGTTLALFLPASKGQRLFLIYTSSGTLNYFRFVYANGTK